MALHKNYNYFIDRNSIIHNNIVANHTIIAINNSDNDKR